MPKILALTVFGLNNRFYIKYFIYGVLLAAFLWLSIDYIHKNAIEQGKAGLDTTYIWFNRIWVGLSALLYPYARYLYAKIWGFFFGESEWYLGGILLLLVYYFKLMVRVCLFLFAVFIAPIAWLVLYFDNRKFY
ncbi:MULTISPECIES: hypothetical protein [Moraxella]|uniref:Uncharacterized protein n=1 Tax=Moraxella catarrhalis TaxID=480 RepID=A0A7Z0UXM4_MORCA|nr:hypothetical protein [Moraxella catarrhalis]OAV00146.1 hypothetical protein AO382_1624 [Moraxella catarrhalis]STY81189.1 Uncharacterised protein [Moraxella catarrhalis]